MNGKILLMKSHCPQHEQCGVGGSGCACVLCTSELKAYVNSSTILGGVHTPQINPFPLAFKESSEDQIFINPIFVRLLQINYLLQEPVLCVPLWAN